MLEKQTAVLAHLNFLSTRQYKIGPRILDFGCGNGDTVQHLLSLGYDAHGVEVENLWSRIGRELPGRLHLVDRENYRLPFDNGTFDVVLSDQVFEHVENLEESFSEILRVLKPGGVSVHRFPGPLGLVESHTKLPFTALCLSSAYISACALAGLRTPEQRGKPWYSVRDYNLWLMSLNFYPPKWRIRSAAKRCGGVAEFWERRELLERDFGRAARVLNLARTVGLAGLLSWAVSPLLQRYMVLRAVPVTEPTASWKHRLRRVAVRPQTSTTAVPLRLTHERAGRHGVE